MPTSAPPSPTGTPALATLAGGCFWCLDAAFAPLRGVLAIRPGYMGGNDPAPTYESVCSGRTGHAEVIEIAFDPSQISYRELLDVFFAIHDPTTLNRQGHDIGTQYRSAIFCHDAVQTEEARAHIAALTTEGHWSAPIVTEATPAGRFHVAEAYHHRYFENNPYQGYCQAVVAPKVLKVRELFRALLRRD